jgi:hypothetical protein
MKKVLFVLAILLVVAAMPTSASADDPFTCNGVPKVTLGEAHIRLASTPDLYLISMDNGLDPLMVAALHLRFTYCYGQRNAFQPGDPRWITSYTVSMNEFAASVAASQVFGDFGDMPLKYRIRSQIIGSYLNAVAE